MFYLTGVIITLFLAFILLCKKDKTNADWLLFFWLLVIGCHLYMYYSYFSKAYLRFPYWLGLNIPFPLFHGPFLFLYTAAVTNQIKKWQISFLHFIPVILSFISIYSFLKLPIKSKIVAYKNGGIEFQDLMQFTSIAISCSGIIYVVWSLLLLKKHKKNLSNLFSYSEKINLKWLQYLIYGIAIIWLFVFFGSEELLFAMVVLFVVFIGYFGINQIGIFTKNTPLILDQTIECDTNNFNPSYSFVQNAVLTTTNVLQKPKESKYTKSGLSNNTAIAIYQVLQKRMAEEKFYLNSELTLVELADKLAVSPNNLSQVINTFEQKNFYDYINSYRIERFIAIAKLPENKKYTILSLAFDCGFNSKSSFNKYFKKVTNKTPTQYISQINQ